MSQNSTPHLQDLILSHLIQYGLVDNVMDILSSKNFQDFEGKPYQALFQYLTTHRHDAPISTQTPEVQHLFYKLLGLNPPIEMVPLYLLLVQVNIKEQLLTILTDAIEIQQSLIKRKLLLDALEVVQKDDFDPFVTIPNLISYFTKNEIEHQEITELNQNILQKIKRIKNQNSAMGKLRELVKIISFSGLKNETKILLESALIVEQKDHIPLNINMSIYALLQLNDE
jgi:hypothetical protein